MKTLLLMRHAKSSWKNSALPDHDRPLNRRGRHAAPLIGNLIRQERLIPEAILCSSAVRARQTCELVAAHWKTPPEPQFLSALYHCPVAQFVESLKCLPDSADRVLLIGHNPGLADFLEAVTGFEGKFPTAALAQLEIGISNWRELSPQTKTKLVQVRCPRELS